LGIAGAISVLSSLSSAHRLPDRLFGGFFGLLLVAAAVDELFEFHEHSGQQIDMILPSESQLTGQDMVTLGIAVFGVVAAVMAVLVVRFMPWAKNLILERRYRRTFSLFVLAVLTFLTAMTLDSFDWYLELLANQLRTTILGHSGTNEVPPWLGVMNMTQAANSLEELLEYLAALFFLMMIGTLFSVKVMGCDLPSNKKM
jgi:H+/Cl- antiporter ClcA